MERQKILDEITAIDCKIEEALLGEVSVIETSEAIYRPERSATTRLIERSKNSASQSNHYYRNQVFGGVALSSSL